MATRRDFGLSSRFGFFDCGLDFQNTLEFCASIASSASRANDHASCRKRATSMAVTIGHCRIQTSSNANASLHVSMQRST
jgi:hypothetical protein